MFSYSISIALSLSLSFLPQSLSSFLSFIHLNYTLRDFISEKSSVLAASERAVLLNSMEKKIIFIRENIPTYWIDKR